MKSLTINMMFAAAALMVGSTAVSAQTLKADVPFDFQARGHKMPAGQYTVNRSSGEKTFVIRNTGTNQSLTLMVLDDRDVTKDLESNDGGFLQFTCVDGCRLQQIYTHKGYPAHVVGPEKQAEGARLAMVRLAVDKVRK